MDDYPTNSASSNDETEFKFLVPASILTTIIVASIIAFVYFYL